MQAVAAGCGIPDQVSNHVRPVTKDVQQALLALILLVLTTYAHDGQSSVSNNRLYVSVWGGGGHLSLLPHYASRNSSEWTTAKVHCHEPDQSFEYTQYV